MIAGRCSAVLRSMLLAALLSEGVFAQEPAPPNPHQLQRADNQPPPPGLVPDIDDPPGQPRNPSQQSSEHDWDKRFPAFFQAAPIKDAADHDELQRLKYARYNTVVAELQARVAMFRAGIGEFALIADAARRLVKGSADLNLTSEQQIALLTQQVDLLKLMEAYSEANWERGTGTMQDLHLARYLRLDAEIELLTLQRSLQGEPAK